MECQLDVSANTDCGKVRWQNEDRFYCDSQVALVADGCGGSVDGALAAQIAMVTLIHLQEDDAMPSSNATPEEVSSWLRDFMEYANQQVVSKAKGSATTLTVGFLDGDQLHIGHIGDSRAYRITNGGEFEQLTTDHVRDRHILTRYIGNKQFTNDQVECLSVVVSVGDVFLFCSDGLYGYVAAEAIAKILSSGLSAEEMCAALISSALEVGAPDNVTCVVWRVLPVMD